MLSSLLAAVCVGFWMSLDCQGILEAHSTLYLRRTSCCWLMYWESVSDLWQYLSACAELWSAVLYTIIERCPCMKKHLSNHRNLPRMYTRTLADEIIVASGVHNGPAQPCCQLNHIVLNPTNADSSQSLLHLPSKRTNQAIPSWTACR